MGKKNPAQPIPLDPAKPRAGYYGLDMTFVSAGEARQFTLEALKQAVSCIKRMTHPPLFTPTWRKNGRYHIYGEYRVYWRRHARNFCICRERVGIDNAKTIEEAKAIVEATYTLEQEP